MKDRCPNTKIQSTYQVRYLEHIFSIHNIDTLYVLCRWAIFLFAWLDIFPFMLRQKSGQIIRYLAKYPLIWRQQYVVVNMFKFEINRPCNCHSSLIFTITEKLLQYVISKWITLDAILVRSGMMRTDVLNIHIT